MLATFLLVCGLGFLFLFWCSLQSYRESDRAYTALQAQLSWQQTDNEPLLDFSPLLAQNPDTVAWLEIPALELSLPVAQNADSTYYLKHGFDGSKNAGGCLFLAGQDTAEWTAGSHHVIYGHNLHTGAMFGELQAYRDEAFYRENPTFVLYTPTGSWLCRVFAVCDATDSDENYTLAWEKDAARTAAVEAWQQNSLYDTGVTPAADSCLVTLSTCASTYARNDKRFVVHALLEATAQEVKAG